jgi:outer membrane protein assembly factor BamB
MRILLLVLTLAQCGLCQSTFHGNNARTGSYSAPGPRQFHAVKWKAKTNGPIFSSPALAEGSVYIGSADTNIYSFDLQTGKQNWAFKTGGPVNSSPAVSQGMVYFVSYDGKLYALDAKSGVKKWEFATEGERHFQAPGIHGVAPRSQIIFDPFDIFLSSPAVDGNAVYFGSGDGNIYCVDAASGKLRWKFKTGDVVHASPAVVDGVVYVGSWDSYLYALDAATGAEKWRFKSGEDKQMYNQVGFQSSPAVVDGVVYVGCRDAHLYAIDARTGEKKWDYFANMSWVNSTPALSDGKVYAGTSDSGRFFSFDTSSGKISIDIKVGGLFFSSPAIAGGLAYIGNHTGKLYAIDTASGAVAWTFQTDGSRENLDKIYGPDGRRKPDAFQRFFYDAADLYSAVRQSWSVGSILSSPVVQNGTLYFGSTDGNLYAIE